MRRLAFIRTFDSPIQRCIFIMTITMSENILPGYKLITTPMCKKVFHWNCVNYCRISSIKVVVLFFRTDKQNEKVANTLERWIQFLFLHSLVQMGEETIRLRWSFSASKPEHFRQQWCNDSQRSECVYRIELSHLFRFVATECPVFPTSDFLLSLSTFSLLYPRDENTFHLFILSSWASSAWLDRWWPQPLREY